MSVVASALAVSALHRDPARTSELVSEVLCGERLIVLTATPSPAGERWLRIRGEDGYEGWLPAGETAPVDPGWPGPDPVRIRAREAALRDASSGRVRARLVFGGVLAARGRSAGSVLAELPDGARGALDPGALEPFYGALPPGAGIADVVRAMATALEGIPYRWGGRSVHGLDCSALAQLILGEVGLRLPRDAHLQEAWARECGQRVDPGETRAADLLFWGDDTRADHVAVALDGDTFIHARRWVRVGAHAGGADGDLAPRFRGVYRVARRS